MKRTGIFLIILLCFSNLFAQTTVKVGGWQMYFNYNNGKQIEQIGDELFYASQKSLLHFNLTDNELTRLSKYNGLSDIDIACMGVVDNKYLVIAYHNANIDIYEDGHIYNIPDMLNKQISGDKRINEVVAFNGYAYLACGFGIVCLDLKKKIVKDTWFFQNAGTQYPVLGLTFARDSAFALTEKNIYKTAINNNQINDISTWEKEENTDNQTYISIKSIGNVLFCLKTDTIWTDNSYYIGQKLHINTNGQWKKDPTMATWNSFKNMEVRQDRIYFFEDWGLSIYTLTTDMVLQLFSTYYCDKVISAIYDGASIYMASQKFGFVHSYQGEKRYISVSSPAQDGTWKMDWKQGKLSAVHGISSDMLANYNDGTSSQMVENQWTSIKPGNFTFYDLIDTKIAPYDTSITYSVALIGGLVKIQNGEVVQLYDKTNSSLQGFSENPELTMATALEFDLQQNLWVGNYYVSRPLSVLTKEGAWMSYPLPYGNTASISTIFCDSRGWLWLTTDKGKTFMLFNSNKTPLNPSDDAWLKLNTMMSEADGPFSVVNVIKEDRDGKIWIGTDAGIKYYSSPSKLFDNPNTLPSPIVVNRITETDTFAEVVLKSEYIHSIAIDGGNRKWIATDNAGVFLLSEDAKTELFHFTAENSPLLSNAVLDIVIDGYTGEVFFATDQGLVSFRYTATEPKDDLENINIFPNPVKPYFDGYISISGLMEDAEVKITDARGALVYRTTSNGGTAVWDGRRFDGTKASSGVYFVFVAAGEKLKYKKAGKILFLK